MKKSCLNCKYHELHFYENKYYPTYSHDMHHCLKKGIYFKKYKIRHIIRGMFCSFYKQEP